MSFPLVFLVHIFNFLSQTLTTLNLQWNHIGDEEAKALADAFRGNQVNIFFS
jgi:hypothetical protein